MRGHTLNFYTSNLRTLRDTGNLSFDYDFVVPAIPDIQITTQVPRLKLGTGTSASTVSKITATDINGNEVEYSYGTNNQSKYSAESFNMAINVGKCVLANRHYFTSDLFAHLLEETNPATKFPGLEVYLVPDFFVSRLTSLRDIYPGYFTLGTNTGSSYYTMQGALLKDYLVGARNNIGGLAPDAPLRYAYTSSAEVWNAMGSRKFLNKYGHAQSNAFTSLLYPKTDGCISETAPRITARFENEIIVKPKMSVGCSLNPFELNTGKYYAVYFDVDDGTGTNTVNHLLYGLTNTELAKAFQNFQYQEIAESEYNTAIHSLRYDSYTTRTLIYWDTDEKEVSYGSTLTPRDDDNYSRNAPKPALNTFNLNHIYNRTRETMTGLVPIYGKINSTYDTSTVVESTNNKIFAVKPNPFPYHRRTEANTSTEVVSADAVGSHYMLPSDCHGRRFYVYPQGAAPLGTVSSGTKSTYESYFGATLLGHQTLHVGKNELPIAPQTQVRAPYNFYTFCDIRTSAYGEEPVRPSSVSSYAFNYAVSYSITAPMPVSGMVKYREITGAYINTSNTDYTYTTMFVFKPQEYQVNPHYYARYSSIFPRCNKNYYEPISSKFAISETPILYSFRTCYNQYEWRNGEIYVPKGYCIAVVFNVSSNNAYITNMVHSHMNDVYFEFDLTQAQYNNLEEMGEYVPVWNEDVHLTNDDSAITISSSFTKMIETPKCDAMNYFEGDLGTYTTRCATGVSITDGINPNCVVTTTANSERIAPNVVKTYAGSCYIVYLSGYSLIALSDVSANACNIGGTATTATVDGDTWYINYKTFNYQQPGYYIRGIPIIETTMYTITDATYRVYLVKYIIENYIKCKNITVGTSITPLENGALAEAYYVDDDDNITLPLFSIKPAYDANGDWDEETLYDTVNNSKIGPVDIKIQKYSWINGSEITSINPTANTLTFTDRYVNSSGVITSNTSGNAYMVAIPIEDMPYSKYKYSAAWTTGSITYAGRFSSTDIGTTYSTKFTSSTSASSSFTGNTSVLYTSEYFVFSSYGTSLACTTFELMRVAGG